MVVRSSRKLRFKVNVIPMGTTKAGAMGRGRLNAGQTGRPRVYSSVQKACLSTYSV
jgi:hypothetical protein